MADHHNLWALYSSLAVATTSLLLLAAALLRNKKRGNRKTGNWKLRDFGLFGVFLSAILIASDLYACSLLKILIDMSASLKVSARLHKNLLHCNRFSESGRFSFSRIGRKSGVKIHVRFALRHCRADRSGRQIVACKPAFSFTT